MRFWGCTRPPTPGTSDSCTTHSLRASLSMLSGTASPHYTQLRRADLVVEEMINRLQDVASKFFVCEALEAISSFMASQRRRAIAARARAERAKSKQNGNPKKTPITGRHSRADRARPSSSFGAGPSSSGLGPSSSAAGPSGASTSTAQPTPNVTRTPPFGDESDDEDFMPALMFDFPKPGLEDLD
ncbi:hypothetical protein M422DRAFT_71419 [Sphaerobolus stellatus SS14]|uniref:Uncharacterized protein n=1 Tax=Sphaerobolus stellatus (strain SS14) TaxID=990650 RepID=A0A0C9UHN3_SPHS4|nr:hypothetical protein M422DRAFT_71419 [Sphaerobolus stellatus SS14]